MRVEGLSANTTEAEFWTLQYYDADRTGIFGGILEIASKSAAEPVRDRVDVQPVTAAEEERRRRKWV